ncbi:hypothetical protein L484_023827 [Morus notabilis]|uniref:Uncharacterized protein n=1 Tax=Morus notabilis TaxID=981085 RepID=W9R531_9ROSA|nr:hypothetical protein L484_023827 [Morus notabilis]
MVQSVGLNDTTFRFRSNSTKKFLCATLPKTKKQLIGWGKRKAQNVFFDPNEGVKGLQLQIHTFEMKSNNGHANGAGSFGCVWNSF